MVPQASYRLHAASKSLWFLRFNDARVKYTFQRCRYATSIPASIDRTRNIGIIAHIDAVSNLLCSHHGSIMSLMIVQGKTTTTERMLYYSGFTRRIGDCSSDVDEGSTVTDFLPAERARGITIQSAAISFLWPPGASEQKYSNSAPRSTFQHNVNLIDTPGHADFTFEVLRSLRVLDGAVCIIDGVAGVEAQTEKVWAQASAYNIPKIVFVNKLDRDGAAFGRAVREIGARLHAWPAVCGLPWWTADGRLKGVIDVVGLRGLEYEDGSDGKNIQVFGLDELVSQDAVLAKELKKARFALIELLSEHDDVMVEHYLEADEDHLAISPGDVTASLRRVVLMQPQVIIPVFAGASFRNVGVQPLLDAVVDLLPSPLERPDPEISLENNTKGGLTDFLSGNLTTMLPASPKVSGKALSKDKANLALQNLEACALAFKVVADGKRGVLVYVRVYSGVLNPNVPLWNTSLRSTERCQRLLKMYANDAIDVGSIPAGQIGVIPGLKLARTGDTLISYTGAHPKLGPPEPMNSLQLRPIDVPPPVFFVSVEANSLSEEKHIRETLDLLLREDPSLQVSIDEESGQTHLAGMGELHLEIARDRLVSDMKAKARIGSIEIGYREAVTGASGIVEEFLDRSVGGKTSRAGARASVERLASDALPLGKHSFTFQLQDDNRLTIETPTLSSDGKALNGEQPELPSQLSLQTILRAFRTGTSAALARGPTHGYPVHSAAITLTFDHITHVFADTTPASLSSTARFAVQRALRQSVKSSPSVMMEPVMLATISVPESSLGNVVHDISSQRGGSVVSLGTEDEPGIASPSKYGVDVPVNKIYAPLDPFAGGHTATTENGGLAERAQRQILARVPLKEMVGYLKHLRSLTGGRGTFTMVVDRFEQMSGMRQKAVLSEIRGEFKLNAQQVATTLGSSGGRGPKYDWPRDAVLIHADRSPASVHSSRVQRIQTGLQHLFRVRLQPDPKFTRLCGSGVSGVPGQFHEATYARESSRDEDQQRRGREPDRASAPQSPETARCHELLRRNSFSPGSWDFVRMFPPESLIIQLRTIFTMRDLLGLTLQPQRRCKLKAIGRTASAATSVVVIAAHAWARGFARHVSSDVLQRVCSACRSARDTFPLNLDTSLTFVSPGYSKFPSQDGEATKFLNGDCAIFCLASCCHLGWIPTMLKRGEIRSRFGVRGDGCKDCL
nr:ribosome-releasing factor 2, mitochondrial [Quercus suber]